MSSEIGCLVPLIDHFTTHYCQKDLRIQDLCLGDGGQILIEDGQVRQLANFD